MSSKLVISIPEKQWTRIAKGQEPAGIVYLRNEYDEVDIGVFRDGRWDTELGTMSDDIVWYSEIGIAKPVGYEEFTDDIHKITTAMTMFGGSFVKELAKLYFRCDSENQRNLLSVFGNYFRMYREIYKANEAAEARRS